MLSDRMDNAGLLPVSTASVVETAQRIDVDRRNQTVLANLLVGEHVPEQERSSHAIERGRGPTNNLLTVSRSSFTG